MRLQLRHLQPKKEIEGVDLVGLNDEQLKLMCRKAEAKNPEVKWAQLRELILIARDERHGIKAAEGLCCGICLEEYSETEQRVPRSLRCGHSICEGCKVDIPQHQGQAGSCPECETAIGVRTAAELPNTFAILQSL